MPSHTFADIVYALRTFRKQPSVTLVILVTLAVAIGANTAMFSAINAAFLERLPFPDPERLVVGRATFDGRINPMASAQDFDDYRRRADAFESLGAITAFTRSVTASGPGELGQAEPEQVERVVVSWNLFQALGVTPSPGRGLAPEDGVSGAEDVAIVSHSFWVRSLGGSPDVIGRSVQLDGRPHTVVGVMPGGFHFLWAADVWVPMRLGEGYAGARRYHNWLVVGRLAPEASLAQAQAQVGAISSQLAADYPETNEGKALLLAPLGQVLVEGYRPSLLLLMGAVALVLLIACANVAGLLLARGSVRQKELAVRSSLGATRGRLLRQLLTESLTLSLVAGAAGVGFAYWLRALLLSLVPLDTLGVGRLPIDGRVLGFSLALTLVTSLLLGIVPALRGSQVTLADGLGAEGRSSSGRSTVRFRAVLVVTQVALSTVLLVGSGLLIRSFVTLAGVDPGFDAERVLTAEIRLPEAAYEEPARRVQFFTRLLERTRALPGVSEAGAISQLPIRDPGNNIYVYDAASAPPAPREAPLAYTRTVLPGYFEAMGIPLLAGRDIAETDTLDAPPVLVIDREMGETLFSGRNPLGRRVGILTSGEPIVAEVVGLVGDARMGSLSDQPEATMYGSYFQRPLTTMRIALRTGGDPEATAPALRSVVRELDPSILLARTQSLETIVAATMSDRRVVMAALTLFALVALGLSMVGVYGVLSYLVNLRKHEIGVRMALGARPGKVLGMILSHGLSMVALGLALGAAGGVVVGRVLREQLYGVGPSDPATHGMVVLLLAGVAFVSCLLPARRAMATDPAIALRAE